MHKYFIFIPLTIKIFFIPLVKTLYAINRIHSNCLRLTPQYIHGISDKNFKIQISVPLLSQNCALLLSTNLGLLFLHLYAGTKNIPCFGFLFLPADKLSNGLLGKGHSIFLAYFLKICFSVTRRHSMPLLFKYHLSASSFSHLLGLSRSFAHFIGRAIVYCPVVFRKS